jgi:hypothetical protein
MTTPAGNRPAEPSKEALDWICSQNEGFGPDIERAIAYDAGAAAAIARVRAEVDRLLASALADQEENDDDIYTAWVGAYSRLLAWLDAEQKEEKE